MQTKLAVPIAAQNLDQAKQQIKAAQARGAEMLELRTDYLEDLSVDLVKNLIAEANSATGQELPIIVTCRDKQQGGARPYPDQLRIDVLTSAVGAGAEFIDFEYENFLSTENQEKIKLALSQSSKARLIMSAHNFETKFDNIGKLHRHILTVYPAAIPKLVYTTNHINDCFEAFDLLHQTGGERIVFCMGEAGLISRIIAKKLVHNACFADKGMNKLYLPLLVEGGEPEFNQFLRNILARGWLGFRGFSVTIPHKQNGLNFVKQNQGFVEPLAEKIGAVNTILSGADGQLGAYNTDYAGALDAITSTLGITRADLNGLAVAIIGAGGVARATVAGLTDAGAQICIYNRTVKRGEKLAADFNCDFAPLSELPNVEAKLLINCTNIGMHPNVDETPLPKECIKKDMTVFDTVYNPAETLLLKQAKEVGAKTIDGLSMFINQACAQFKLFTGTDANAELMRKTVIDCLPHE